MVELLHELTAALEQQYLAQLRRYYHLDGPSARERDLGTPRVSESDGAPF